MTSIEIPAEFVGAFRHYATDELRFIGSTIEDDAAILNRRSPDEGMIGHFHEQAEYLSTVVPVVSQVQADGPATVEGEASVLRSIIGSAVTGLGDRLYGLTDKFDHLDPTVCSVEDVERTTSELRYFTRLWSRVEGEPA